MLQEAYLFPEICLPVNVPEPSGLPAVRKSFQAAEPTPLCQKIRPPESIFALEFHKSLWDDARQNDKNRIEHGFSDTNTEGISMIESVMQSVETASSLIEILAVVLIVAAIVYGTASYTLALLRRHIPVTQAYTRYRYTLARVLMLALELLVAADLTRTVAFEPSFHNIGVLGLLIVIRIILGWSLVVEIEGRWPWQPPSKNEP